MSDHVPNEIVFGGKVINQAPFADTRFFRNVVQRHRKQTIPGCDLNRGFQNRLTRRTVCSFTHNPSLLGRHETKMTIKYTFTIPTGRYNDKHSLTDFVVKDREPGPESRGPFFRFVLGPSNNSVWDDRHPFYLGAMIH